MRRVEETILRVYLERNILSVGSRAVEIKKRWKPEISRQLVLWRRSFCIAQRRPTMNDNLHEFDDDVWQSLECLKHTEVS